MRYEGVVYRPPSEAYSLIIQLTVGCAHNACTFCTMYKDKKFRMRNIEEVFEELDMAKQYYGKVNRIFLADGDALNVNASELKKILLKIKEKFPQCERVGIYGTPKDILNKSIEELKVLRDLGLGIIYMGVESGSDAVLKKVNKGIASSDMIKAGIKVKEAGIKLSVTLISGLGGKGLWREHALNSAKVVNSINPDFIGLLTLIIDEKTPMLKEIEREEFKLLSPKEIMIETKLLVENLKLSNCVFRSNHASNYVALGGVLPNEKQSILDSIDATLNGACKYKREEFRGF